MLCSATDTDHDADDDGAESCENAVRVSRLRQSCSHLSITVPRQTPHDHAGANQYAFILTDDLHKVSHSEQKSAEKIVINNTMNLFFKLHFGNLKPRQFSDCCSMKLLPYILFDKVDLYFIIENGQPKGTSSVPVVSTHFRSL